MKKRIAIIDKQKCHPNECGNYLCIKLCPVNRTGSECIKEDPITKKAVIDEMLCTGCGICPKRCPFGAIEIINLPDTLTKNPIHRYGENMFELYHLPAPVPNKVTGILGKNGIGKSTAMKVMAKLIEPNLGNWEQPPTFQEVIQSFRGTELQSFLEKLDKDQIKLSFKPQQVEFIPKQFSGTVRELLEKIASKEKIEHVAKELDLTNVLERDLTKVSGGELQRAAIAAAALKDANLFLFDEPTSYLDIKQRINISRFIRTLAKEDTSTLVIEHDLIILDYMTDMLNIMYGHENAFGIVSGLKSSREGINAFLEGFLKEENVRFRSSPIKFEKGQQEVQVQRQELVSWSEIVLDLGDFTLQANKGSLQKGQIIGVLGENGIGKSSFIRMLAGQIKPSKGEISTDVKVAYKPQYLEPEQDITVAEFLVEAISKFDRQLIVPLDLEKLYAQKLSELSGGQLQRVMLAHTLAQDAELFLIDEPTAYLDVEQRLAIAKVIKNAAFERDLSLLIIDHDLMFMDYLADELIVFSGTPGKQGELTGPFEIREGMNNFLKVLGITLRRDIHSNRPRINKPGSVKDREQRQSNQWYG